MTLKTILMACLVAGRLGAQAAPGTAVDLAGIATVTVPPGTRYYTRAEAEAVFHDPLLETGAPWIGAFAPEAAGEGPGPAWLVRVEYHPIGHLVVSSEERMVDGAVYRAVAKEVEADNARRAAAGFEPWTPAVARDVTEVFLGDFRSGPSETYRLQVSVGGATGYLKAGIRFTRDGYLRWVSGPLPPPPLDEIRPERAIAALESLQVAPEARYAAWAEGEPLAGTDAAEALGIRTEQPTASRALATRLGVILLGLLAVAAPFVRIYLRRRLRERFRG